VDQKKLIFRSVSAFISFIAPSSTRALRLHIFLYLSPKQSISLSKAEYGDGGAEIHWASDVIPYLMKLHENGNYTMYQLENVGGG
jgi:hypothetical protein